MSKKKLRLQTTDGRHIIGTLERVYGCAYIDEASVYLDDGRVKFDYEGSTEIYWDGQETVHGQHGERIFITEDGEEVSERIVVAVADDEDDE